MSAPEQAVGESSASARGEARRRQDQATIAVSVCVCTRNRPDELRRALESVHTSRTLVHQIIVSDDSDDDRVRSLVQSDWSEVTYVKGPGQGLGANRNRALRLVTGSHVLFLDDDAELAKDFLTLTSQRLQGLPLSDRRQAIVAGTEMKSEEGVTPHDQGWLGFQNRRYKAGQPLRTVVINAAVFPRQLFDQVQFDPSLVYGYDEVDVTTQAVALGFTIIPCFDAMNRHHPSALGREEYRPFTGASRLYVTLKRRRWTEGSRLRAWSGFGLGVVHTYMAAIKRSGFHGFGEGRKTVALARAYYRDFLEATRAACGGSPV